MNSLKEHFHTDWAAMTTNDWIGTILTLVVFLLMAGLYIYVLHPKNRDKIESKKHIPVDDDISSGDKNGR